MPHTVGLFSQTASLPPHIEKRAATGCWDGAGEFVRQARFGRNESSSFCKSLGVRSTVVAVTPERAVERVDWLTGLGHLMSFCK